MAALASLTSFTTPVACCGRHRPVVVIAAARPRKSGATRAAPASPPTATVELAPSPAKGQERPKLELVQELADNGEDVVKVLAAAARIPGLA